jgi:hypothetical protein
MIKLGTVTDNQDPDRGISSSQWLSRITNFDGDDLPSPMIGSTVAISEVGGDATEDIILGVLQTATTNRPIDDKPDRESWWSILKEIGFWVNRKFTIRSPSPNKPAISLDRDGTITASNTLGTITLLPTGYITVTNPTGILTMGGGGWTIATAGTVAITTPSLKWNGSTVAVVGGVDSDGDVTIS